MARFCAAQWALSLHLDPPIQNSRIETRRLRAPETKPLDDSSTEPSQRDGPTAKFPTEAGGKAETKRNDMAYSRESTHGLLYLEDPMFGTSGMLLGTTPRTPTLRSSSFFAPRAPKNPLSAARGLQNQRKASSPTAPGTPNSRFKVVLESPKLTSVSNLDEFSLQPL